MGFLLRTLISAVSLWLAANIIPGIYVDGWKTLFLAALLLGLVNAVLKPILIFLTLPITLVTLGLFLLVLNAAMLGLVAWMLPGFAISGLIPAMLGWLLMTIVSALAHELV
jgi:putative membrane protein